jgi:hypothetical protein
MPNVLQPLYPQNGWQHSGDPTETSPVYPTAFSVPLNSTMNVKVRAFLTDWVTSRI